MSRGMVGLLAAVGVAVSALVGFVHGGLLPVAIVGAGVATGLAAYMALPPSKKDFGVEYFTGVGSCVRVRRRVQRDGLDRLLLDVGSWHQQAGTLPTPR